MNNVEGSFYSRLAQVRSRFYYLYNCCSIVTCLAVYATNLSSDAASPRQLLRLALMLSLSVLLLVHYIGYQTFARIAMCVLVYTYTAHLVLDHELIVQSVPTLICTSVVLRNHFLLESVSRKVITASTSVCDIIVIMVCISYFVPAEGIHLSYTAIRSAMSNLSITILIFIYFHIQSDSLRNSAFDEMKRYNESVKKAIEDKEGFFAEISHEIRNPLQSLLVSTELLHQGMDKSQQSSLIMTIKNCCEIVLNIVSNVLDVSKIQANKLELLKTPASLNESINKILRLSTGRARAKGLSITYLEPKQLPPCILFDPQRLYQVVINLVSNAIKFTHKGHIVVSAVWTPLAPDADVKAGIASEIKESNWESILYPMQEVEDQSMERFKMQKILYPYCFVPSVRGKNGKFKKVRSVAEVNKAGRISPKICSDFDQVCDDDAHNSDKDESSPDNDSKKTKESNPPMYVNFPLASREKKLRARSRFRNLKSTSSNDNKPTQEDGKKENCSAERARRIPSNFKQTLGLELLQQNRTPTGVSAQNSSLATGELQNLLRNSAPPAVPSPVQPVNGGSPGSPVIFPVQKAAADQPFTPVKGLVKIEVMDTGIGISKEGRKKLFQRYQQADSSVSQNYGGTGLGLWISRSLVQMMGGDIQVKSKVGVGSSMIVVFPSETCPEVAAVSDKCLRRISRNLKGKKCMVVDDSVDSTNTIRQLLELNELKAVVYNRAHEALESYKESADIDLVITDLRMPEMSGQSLILEIRKFETERRHPRVPIMILTADNSQNERTAYLSQYGADEYLLKPTKLHDLIGAVEKLLLQGRSKLTRKIMVIDDETISRKLISTLIRQNGDEPSEFGTIEEAKQNFTDNCGKYDLIFLDSQLPDGSGIDFMAHYARVLRARDASNIPVVSMSGNSVRDQEILYKDYNIHAFLEKPVSRATLLDIISSIRQYNAGY